MVSAIFNSESACLAVLESDLILTNSQLLLSQTLQNFCKDVSSLSSLFGIGCGQIIAPFFRLQSARCLTQILGNSRQAKLVSYYASLAIGLGVEGTSMHAGTEYIRTGRVEEGVFTGSLNSTFMIIACKAASKIVPSNIVMHHFAQNAAIVGYNEFSCRIGLSEKVDQSLMEKFLHAEVAAIQLQCSALYVRQIPSVALIHANCETSYQPYKPQRNAQRQNLLANDGLFIGDLHSREKISFNLKKQITTLQQKIASFQYANKTDLLIASSLMFAGCQGEQGGMIGGGMFYLLGKGVQRLIGRRNRPLSEHSEQKRPPLDGEKVFADAIYELADFLNRKDIKDNALDPYLIATHERRDQLIETIQKLFPEITQSKRQALFLEDLLKTPLLLSKTPQEFVVLLDTLLERTSELRSKLTPHFSTVENIEAETVRRGDTPDNLSGIWINILKAVLKEAHPSVLSSVSTNRLYPIDPDGITPEKGPLDHLFPFDFASTSSGKTTSSSSRLSRPKLPRRERSDGSIGSAHTRLIQLAPSSLTAPADYDLLPENGSPATHVIVFQEADISPHRKAILDTFPPRVDIHDLLSLRSDKKAIPPSVLLTDTTATIPDLMRLEEEAATLKDTTPTPVVEVFILDRRIPHAFRMETYQTRIEETRIPGHFEKIERVSEIQRVIRRAFYGPNNHLLGMVETAAISRDLLRPLLDSQVIPSSINTIIDIMSITPEWIKIHKESVYFLHKKSHRALLRGLCYELACQKDPYFNPYDSHTADFLYTGIEIQSGDSIDFHHIPTDSGAHLLVYNQREQLIFQMHYTRADSSASPIISTISGIHGESPSSQTTIIPEAGGRSKDTLLEFGDDRRETVQIPLVLAGSSQRNK